MNSLYFQYPLKCSEGKVICGLRLLFHSPQGQPSLPPDYCGRRSWAEHQRWMSLKGSVSRKTTTTTTDNELSLTLVPFSKVTTASPNLYCLPAGSRCRIGVHTYQWQRGRWTPPGCVGAHKRGGGKLSTPG